MPWSVFGLLKKSTVVRFHVPIRGSTVLSESFESVTNPQLINRMDNINFILFGIINKLFRLDNLQTSDNFNCNV